MEVNKDVLNIVVVGHVDHGKSTVIGRLLHDTHSLPEGTIDKVKRIAKETGKPFEYAYLLDAFEEEQKQGITIDITQIQFTTKKREYVIIDAPGHKEFLKNMISGAANAEAALLIIDAKEGVQEQSKRHAYILSLLGIKKVFVIINKMDLVGYSEEAFNEVKNGMEKFLGELGVYPLSYIPISAFYGQNVLTKSEEMNWFKGYSIIDAVDSIEKDKGIENKPLRFPIQDVYKFDDRRIISGRIESGTLKVGDKIKIYPEGKNTTVKSIEYWSDRDNKEVVFAGESVGITVSDEFFNKRGEVISTIDNAPKVANSFKANIFWMGKNDLVKNKKYKIKLTTQEVEGEIDSIIKVVDASSLDSSDENTKIVLNDVAEVIIKTKEKLVFDDFSESNITGRFVIVDGYDVAGGGIITGEVEVKTLEESEVFKFGELKAHGDIFEEFYYSVNNNSIKAVTKNSEVYTVGDNVPLKGESFNYPEYLDVLVFRDKVAIKIRDGIISSIIDISEYSYEGYPIVNGRGFGIRVSSLEETKELFKHYCEASELGGKSLANFSNLWLVFDKYRSLVFNGDYI
ncbi:MAG: sulfate adenylyltransferase subunit 1 [Clostridium sp.]